MYELLFQEFNLKRNYDSETLFMSFFNVLLTVQLGTILDNDQLDAQLLYFVLQYAYLHSSTRFEHYMLIVRRLKLY